jgi:hypothetical protein
MDRDLLLFILLVFILLIYFVSKNAGKNCFTNGSASRSDTTKKQSPEPIRETKKQEVQVSAEEEVIREIENNVTKIGLKGLKSGSVLVRSQGSDQIALVPGKKVSRRI